MSRIFVVTHALFGYFWVNLPGFRHVWVDYGDCWTIFKPGSPVGFGLMNQVSNKLRITSRPVDGYVILQLCNVKDSHPVFSPDV